jgi:hypothetical protein
MNAEWSREIRREFAGGEARFDLPVRPLGWGRLFGVLLIGFGLLFVWSPAGELWHALETWLHGQSAGMGVFFGLFSLPFLVAGSIPLAVGLLILFGRSRAEWRDGQLRAAEMLGPLRWTRRLPRKPIRKLEVSAATSKSGTGVPREMAQFSGLMAEFADGSRKLVVLGYPKDWLLPLAQELRPFIGSGQSAAAAVSVEVVEKSAEAENAANVPEQPAGSRVQVEDRGMGVRLVVPPAGIWRGSRGMFFFGLFWCGFMAVFTGISVFAGGKSADGVPGVFWVFIPAFWLIGLGLLASAMNMGRRTASFDATAGRLCVETRGLFGNKRHEWTRADLAAIRADASGMGVNERPVIELQVHPRGGKKVGLLAGRDEEELRWMATRLRQALAVPARETDH